MQLVDFFVASACALLIAWVLPETVALRNVLLGPGVIISSLPIEGN